MLKHGTARLVAVLMAATALLSGCGAGYVDPPAPGATPSADQPAQGINPGTRGVFYEKLPDGYDLLCVYVDGGYDGGLSCNWPGHQAWVDAKAASK